MFAHELRNPLAPIHNAIRLMRLKPMADSQLEWARDVIDRQATQLTRLVDDLLDVSRITRGKINIAVKPLEISAAIARAIETVQPMLTQLKHELRIDLPPTPLLVLGDLMRVTQIIGNVLGNAVKYTDAGGRIELSAQLAGAEVEIRIRDNGIGIPVALQPTVFDLFTQAGTIQERSRGGLGIGLALVKRLIDLHSGSINVHSAGAGQGTEFTIRLPAAREPQGLIVPDGSATTTHACAPTARRAVGTAPGTHRADRLGTGKRPAALERRRLRLPLGQAARHRGLYALSRTPVAIRWFRRCSAEAASAQNPGAAPLNLASGRARAWPRRGLRAT